MGKVAHFLYVPFTGLGLYGGHRGKRWLKNRIKIFKQFVVPSLKAQSEENFILWVSWRHEDRQDPLVRELYGYLKEQGFKVVFTYAGVCFWDDKYPDDVAYNRLVDAVHGSMGELLNVMGEAEEVLMTIQPSDDCYEKFVVNSVQRFFEENKDIHVVGYKKGYVMNYQTLEAREWNPTTTPPFYTIRFPRETFVDPRKHVQYIGPYKSHEYVKDFLPAKYSDDVRGFIVGTHGENISTVFNHPFTGVRVAFDLRNFGLGNVQPLKLRLSFRKWFMRKLPHYWQRKFRYLFGEKLYARFYNWIRS